MWRVNSVHIYMCVSCYWTSVRFSREIMTKRKYDHERFQSHQASTLSLEHQVT